MNSKLDLFEPTEFVKLETVQEFLSKQGYPAAVCDENAALMRRVVDPVTERPLVDAFGTVHSISVRRFLGRWARNAASEDERRALARYDSGGYNGPLASMVDVFYRYAPLTNQLPEVELTGVMHHKAQRLYAIVTSGAVRSFTQELLGNQPAAGTHDLIRTLAEGIMGPRGSRIEGLPIGSLFVSRTTPEGFCFRVEKSPNEAGWTKRVVPAGMTPRLMHNRLTKFGGAGRYGDKPLIPCRPLDFFIGRALVRSLVEDKKIFADNLKSRELDRNPPRRQ